MAGISGGEDRPMLAISEFLYEAGERCVAFALCVFLFVPWMGTVGYKQRLLFIVDFVTLAVAMAIAVTLIHQ
jgi:hypothetical protein